MTYRELRRKFEGLGCRLERQASGSHEIWFNPANGQQTPIPRQGNRDLATSGSSKPRSTHTRSTRTRP